ncbi:MAG: hypothetical protein HZB66_00230 [Candidatus Aenigmarchaeota archaeon]|nr:hypothetical protein [Candidatus Aenigmarchaeota archaeon]
MNVKDAIKRVLDEGGIKARKDYFLASCFTTLKGAEEPSEWIVNFYNPKKKTIVDFYVSSDIKEGGEAPALKPTKPLEPDNVKVELAEVLKNVSIMKGAIKTLVFLHKKHVWTINVIGRSMDVASWEFDARNGELLGKKKTSLILNRK